MLVNVEPFRRDTYLGLLGEAVDTVWRFPRKKHLDRRDNLCKQNIRHEIGQAKIAKIDGVPFARNSNLLSPRHRIFLYERRHLADFRGHPMDEIHGELNVFRTCARNYHAVRQQYKVILA